MVPAKRGLAVFPSPLGLNRLRRAGYEMEIAPLWAHCGLLLKIS